MVERSREKETARLEAFSDGVFAIAITLLAIDLKAPLLDAVSNRGLAAALAERWTEYLAFVNSFVAVLLMWISHHDLFKIIRRADRRLVLANGLLLLFVSAVPYPTSVLGKYLLTDAASAAAAFYAGYCVLVNGAFILFWAVASGEGSLLHVDVSPETIKKTTRGLLVPLPLYAVAAGLAFVNAWITVALTGVLWIYWAINLMEERPLARSSVESR